MSSAQLHRPDDMAALVLVAIVGLLVIRLAVSLVVGAALALLPASRAPMLRSGWVRWSSPLARSLLRALLPVTIAGATVTPAGASAIARTYGPPWPGRLVFTVSQSASAPIPVDRSALPPTRSETTGTTTTGTTTTGTAATGTAATGVVPAVHVVAPGESFWSIAEEHVLQWDPEATERSIARYWVRLVEANTERLPVRSNPDLLLPGTALRMPALRSTGADRSGQ